jgi:Zn-dependent oligopeptidase
MATPSKQPRMSTAEDVIDNTISEVDTILKAVCYDISTNNSKVAVENVEKVRRKLKAMSGKCHALNKQAKLDALNKQAKSEQFALTNLNARLKSENKALMEQVHELKKELEGYEDQSLSVLDLNMSTDKPLLTSTQKDHEI